jgi:tetratricopeptide (TPR) repeat protein
MYAAGTAATISTSAPFSLTTKDLTAFLQKPPSDLADLSDPESEQTKKDSVKHMLPFGDAGDGNPTKTEMLSKDAAQRQLALGMVYLEAGAWDEAIEVFSKVAGSENLPESFEARSGLLRALAAKSRDASQRQLALGRAYAKRGAWDEAVAAFSKASDSEDLTVASEGRSELRGALAAKSRDTSQKQFDLGQTYLERRPGTRRSRPSRRAQILKIRFLQPKGGLDYRMRSMPRMLVHSAFGRGYPPRLVDGGYSTTLLTV